MDLNRKCNNNKWNFPYSYPLIIVVILIFSQLCEQVTGTQQYPRDAVVMAHVIGNGGMNMNHYFHTLGVACENRNPRLWKSIQELREKCISSRSSPRNLLYEEMRQGSFQKVCLKWRMESTCNRNLARDLNNCLSNYGGSDALAFIDAYLGFACMNVRDTENQLVLTTSSLGVFKCFPEVQERIIQCVKGISRIPPSSSNSNGMCSDFETVELCFAKHYTNERDCRDTGVAVYLRDLFRSMSSTLKCPLTSSIDVWEKVKYAPIKFDPISYPFLEFPENDKTGGGDYNTLSPSPSSTLSRKEERILKTNNKGPFSIRVQTDSQTAPPRYNQNLPILLHPHHIVTINNPPHPPPLPYHPSTILVPLKQISVTSPSTDFNLQQQQNKNNSQTWFWDYQRYAYPSTTTTMKDDYYRFFSFRPQNDDQGIHNLYNLDNTKRYGIPPPKPRGLSDRGGRNREIIIKDEEAHTPGKWDIRDNHLRKYKDDHIFSSEILITTTNPDYNTGNLVLLNHHKKRKVMTRNNGTEDIHEDTVNDDNPNTLLRPTVIVRPTPTPDPPAPVVGRQRYRYLVPFKDRLLLQQAKRRGNSTTLKNNDNPMITALPPKDVTVYAMMIPASMNEDLGSSDLSHSPAPPPSTSTSKYYRRPILFKPKAYPWLTEGRGITNIPEEERGVTPVIPLLKNNNATDDAGTKPRFRKIRVRKRRPKISTTYPPVEE